MERFQSTIDINAPASECYSRWRQLEQLPSFMPHVKEVRPIDDRRWHWVVSGPLGVDIEWDAVIDGDVPNRAISWHTTAQPDVDMQGAVLFNETAPGATQVTCTIQYETPLGKPGEWFAQLFSNPEQMVERDLERFKQSMESSLPTADATPVAERMILPLDASLSAPELAERINATETYDKEGETLVIDSIDNESSFGTPVLDTIEEPSDTELLLAQERQIEQNPYLGVDGALLNEDLEEILPALSRSEEDDVYSASMDVDTEDLDNFYEGIDDEIDPAPQGGLSIETYQGEERR